MGLSQDAEIIALCTNLVSRYAHAVNEADTQTFANLFAPDGVWARPGGMTMHGRAEIKAYMDSTSALGRAYRHVNGGAVVDVIDPETATVKSITTAYEADKFHEGRAEMRPAAFLAEYSDLMKKIGNAWFIQRRETKVIFVSPTVLPLPGIDPIAD